MDDIRAPLSVITVGVLVALALPYAPVWVGLSLAAIVTIAGAVFYAVAGKAVYESLKREGTRNCLQSPPRDYEAEYHAMRHRAENAEHEAATAKVDAEEARAHVEGAKESAAKELADLREDFEYRLARQAENHAEEITSALVAAFEEAESHWDSGLSQGERRQAWLAFWDKLDKPIADAVKADLYWELETKP